jgi:hypothetical protein
MIIIVLNVSIKDIGTKGDNFKSVIERKIMYQTTDKPSVPLPTTYKKWPISTTVPCWNCRKSYDSVPIPVVISWDKTIGTKGGFCSPQCANRYLISYRDPDMNERELIKYKDMLIRLCRIMEITYTSEVAPHFYEFY